MEFNRQHNLICMWKLVFIIFYDSCLIFHGVQQTAQLDLYVGFAKQKITRQNNMKKRWERKELKLEGEMVRRQKNRSNSLFEVL